MPTLKPATLSVEDLLQIHEILVAEFAVTPDPISPPGIKNVAMLESAVARQHVGHAGHLKYGDTFSSAATPTFGVCLNHPFHNGNKRTALVAMLVHLDKNNRTMHGADQRTLYELMLDIAQHTVGLTREERRDAGRRRSPDEEVAEIAAWLKRHTRPINRSERQVTFRRLRECLSRFGFELRVMPGNRAEVGKTVERTTGLLRRRTERVWEKAGVIGYRDEGTEVSMRDLKAVRRKCELTEENGVDSDNFYDATTVVDTFVNRHRTLLRRLART